MTTRRLTTDGALRRFVQYAYQLVLGRPPDASGLEHQLNFLSSGGSRAELLKGLAESAEATPLRWGSVAAGRAVALRRRASRSTGLSRVEPQLVELYATLLETAELHQRRLGALESLVHHEAERTERALGQAREQIARAEQLLVDRRAESVSVEATQTELRESLTELRSHVTSPRAVMTTGGVSVVQLEGLLVGVPAAEWRLASFMATTGNPEPGLTRRFRKVVRPGATVVDVGANVGMYTLHAARDVGSSGTVHAFEPTPAVQALLRDNVQLNGLLESGVVHLHPVALSDHDGAADLAIYANNNGHNSLYAKSTEDEIVTVPLSTLDKVLPSGTRVDVVKVDVEGAELAVLRGMPRVAKDNPNIIVFCEFAPEHLERAGISPDAFLTAVSDLGWAAQVVEEPSGELRAVTESDLTAPSRNLQLVRLSAAQLDQ